MTYMFIYGVNIYCVCVVATAYMWKSEDNFRELVLLWVSGIELLAGQAW